MEFTLAPEFTFSSQQCFIIYFPYMVSTSEQYNLHLLILHTYIAIFPNVFILLPSIHHFSSFPVQYALF